jgi:hypothetical protein
MSKSAEKQRVYNLRFDVGPAAEVVTSCLLKIPSQPTDTVLSQSSSPLSQVMSQLVWDNIFGTTSHGICCQGLGPLHGTDKVGFTSHSLKYHAGCQPSGTLGRRDRVDERQAKGVSSPSWWQQCDLIAHDLRVELPFRDGIHHMSMFTEGYTSSSRALKAQVRMYLLPLCSRHCDKKSLETSLPLWQSSCRHVVESMLMR